MDTSDPASNEDLAAELNHMLEETARALFAAGNFENTLQNTVDLAVLTIDGCDYAGMFVLANDVISTPVHTSPIVIELDALQRRAAEGPCLDAVAAGGTFYADDLIDDVRWPHFGPQASSLGIRSALAIALSTKRIRGALNLYARYPRAFGALDRAHGHLLAVMAGIALSAAEAHDQEERRVGELEAGLITRDLIGQAQGILMEREGVTSDQAFDILRRASQHLNIKLRDVAQALVDSGERPDTGSSTS